MFDSSPDAAAPLRPMRQVFIGGSGRSGTTATARLLGRHPSLAMIPAELRIHLADRGLFQLIDEPRHLAAFTASITGSWYRRPRSGAEHQEVGLFELVTIERLEEALATFPERLAVDPDAAARQLIRDLLDPWAISEGKQGWIEHSPENVTVAATLHRLFPDMHFIHSMRDGRDTASSIARMPWGPATLSEALRWWARRLRRGHAELQRIPPGHVLIQQFENLVERERDASYQQLLDFLDLEDDAELRVYFRENILPAKANIGRWKEGMDEQGRLGINRIYEGILESLRREAVPLPLDADMFDSLSESELERSVAEQERYELSSEIAELRMSLDESRENHLTAVAHLDQVAELLRRAKEQRDSARHHHGEVTARAERLEALLDKARTDRDRARARLEGLD